MFCRYCGTQLVGDSIFCSHCGKKIKEETEETVVFNVPFESDPEFIWNLHEFPEQKKTGDIDFSWNDQKSKPDDKRSEPAAKDAPRAKEEKPDQAKEALNKEQEKKIDKFYTFNKKNEEFQKLLDKEYEKIKNNNREEGDIDETNLTLPEEEQEESLEEKSEIKLEIKPEIKPDVKPEIKQEEEKIIFDNETLAKRFDTREFQKDLIESALEKVGAKGVIIEQEQEQTPAPAACESNQEEDVSDFEPRLLEEEEIVQEIAEEVLADELERPVPEDISLDESKQEAFKALEELWNDYEASNIKKTKAFSKEKDQVIKKEQQKKKSSSKGLVGKVILIIIIVLLAIEICILAIRSLTPESKAAEFINEKLSFAVFWINGGEEKLLQPEQDEAEEEANIDQVEEQQDPEPDKQEVPEPVVEPQADKTVLIESQLVHNKNIEKIEANDNLSYSDTKDYQVKDIKNSIPIENNIWINEDNQVVYYDQSLVAALIKFNSEWIDYVNNGDKTILSVTKPDSMAEKNVLNFSKVKAMTKSFKLLQIGEIRKGANAFYVWAHEEISDNENEKITKKLNNWVYQIEPVGNQMLIVGYYPF